MEANLTPLEDKLLKEKRELDLHEITDHDNGELMKNLLENEGLDQQTYFGRGRGSLLSYAADVGAVEVTKALLQYGADPNFGGKTGRIPLYVACRHPGEKFVNIVQNLLDAGANINMKYVNGNTPLLEAVCRSDLEKCHLLIRSGADILARNNGGDTGLHMAAIRGNERIVRLLLEAGMPVDVSTLVGLKTKQNTGFQPLHATAYGIKGGWGRIAQILVDAGADVDAEMHNGRTPLHICAIKNSHHVAKVLLGRGCKVDPLSMENNERKTPLMKAIDATDEAHKSPTTLCMLIEAGADLNTRDVWGMTPISTAVFSNCSLYVKILIQAGCDMNIASTNGMTALRASLKHPPIMTKMLIQAGCYVDLLSRSSILADTSSPIHQHPDYLSWALIEIDNPKKLSHLCRLKLRSVLGVRPQKKIEQLPLPTKLKDYVAFCDLDEHMIE